MRRTVLLAITLICSVAHADPKSDLTDMVGHWLSGVVGPPEGAAPRFAVFDGSVSVSPSSLAEAIGSQPDTANPDKVVVAISTDKTAAWMTSDIAEAAVCGDETCTGKPDGWYHLTALFEIKDKKPVAFLIERPITGKAQAAAMKKGVKLDAVAKGIDKGAEDVATLFQTSIADPKALAATVSDRKDTVMYGSELGERFVGGAKVKSQLAKWNLAFKVRDGIQAGLTASTTVAWVSATVDATPVKKPKATPTPYRVMAIYEKTITSWKLVSLQFAFEP